MARTWRIGEVAERTGLTRRTLRHYDDLGLLTPSERSWGDYRLYGDADLLRLLQIQNLKALGLSLAEIGAALADPNLDASATLRSHLAHLEERIAGERALASRLRTLAGSAERSWDDVMDAIALTTRLAHPDPIVRLRAALQAPRRVSTELLDALVAEPDPAVQEVLIWSLAQQPDAAEAALARLGDAHSPRALLVRLLGKLGGPALVPTLVDLLTDPDRAVVVQAVHALAQSGDSRAAPRLVELLGTGSVPVADLVDAITPLGEAALEPLSRALGSPSAATRSAAAEALGRLGGGLSTEHGGQSSSLLAPLLHDTDPQVRMSALLALGELGRPGREAIESVGSHPQLGPVARRLMRS